MQLSILVVRGGLLSIKNAKIALRPIPFRDQFDALNFALNKKGCTTLFIMDESAYLMTNQVADYSVYGSVRLLVKENPYTDRVERYLTIPKMRSTDVMPDLTVFEITPAGIRLKTKAD